jgi:hypothetical protein
MGYRMKDESRLTEAIFQEVKRRFSSQLPGNYTPGDTRRFARTVTRLNTLASTLRSFPDDVRETIYNGVICTSSKLGSLDVEQVFLG